METLRYKGKLKLYLQLPLYMTLLFVIGDACLFFYNMQTALWIAGFIAVYGLAICIFYSMHRSKFEREIVDYAIHYGMVQKELLNNFKVPYVLLDGSGKIMWMNAEFAKTVDKDLAYRKSITTIFPEITRESLEKAEKTSFDMNVELGEKKYRASIEKMEFPAADEDSEIESLVDTLDSLIAVILFDETDYILTKQANQDQHMVAGLLYIDNYDEVFESIDPAKQSLLLALIERKLTKYFQKADAVMRRMEKDKYFIFFQYKYLAMMEEDNFSILEDIRTVKMGNDMEITISLGLGLNGDRYTQNAQYAHTAIDIALARGGAQVVVKDNNTVSYYGAYGREVERNTRVKARVKASALRELMESRDNVIIMGHSLSDADCLGAAIGVYVAARELGKPTNIVLNTITSTMRPIVETFTENEDYPKDLFVTSDQAINLVDDKTLVMIVDTNRPNYVECPELLKKSKNIVVFDHHRIGEDVIEEPILSYIEPYASSASEMVAEVLQYFSDKIELNPTEADCIFAGILIDTNNFMTKTGVRTFEAAAFLRRNGAEVTRVRKMLREDMDTYKARAEIVRNATVYKNYFAFSVCEPGEDIESPTVLGAMAANELLNIVGIKATFVITNYKDLTYVSSRSIDEINVQMIMQRLGGGGHMNVAGAQITDSSVDQVISDIQAILDEMLEKGEIKIV